MNSKMFGTQTHCDWWAGVEAGQRWGWRAYFHDAVALYPRTKSGAAVSARQEHWTVGRPGTFATKATARAMSVRCCRTRSEIQQWKRTRVRSLFTGLYCRLSAPSHPKMHASSCNSGPSFCTRYCFEDLRISSSALMRFGLGSINFTFLKKSFF